MLPVSNHCNIIAGYLCLALREGTMLNSHDSQNPPSNWRGPYVSSERCTIKCSSMKSGVFPSTLHPTMGGPFVKALPFPKLWFRAWTVNPWTSAVTPRDKESECSSDLTGGWTHLRSRTIAILVTICYIYQHYNFLLNCGIGLAN